MAREIKFRAFIDNKFYIQEHCGGFCYFIHNESDCLSMEDVFVLTESEKCAIQQYTGLKDKNGREIFEGDILRLTYRDIYEIRENGKFVKWSDKEKELHSFYEVGFFNDEFTVNCDEYTILINGWGVKLIRSDDNEDFLIGKINPIGGKIKKQNCGGYGFNSEFLEIVGNILENPDLLAE